MKVTSAFTKPKDFFSLINVYDSHKLQLSGNGFEHFQIDSQQTAFEDAVSYIAASREFDIIHAHDWLTFRAALRAKEESGKPLVVHIHSTERDRAGGQTGSPLVREIEATAMMLADQVIAVSEHTKRAIVEDYGVPAEKISVIHNSVNPNDFAPLNEENDYKYLVAMKACGWKVITYAGRLTIQKGLTHLIRAVAEAMRREPKTFLLLVGNGEQRDELLELAASSEIADRVIFVDFQRGKRLRDAFLATDLFVMPSVSEPFGLVALEAVGYDVPVLVSKQSGVAEVLQNCLKVDYWDTDEMANQITAVLRSSALTEALRLNSKLEFNRLSWDKQATHVMDIYRMHSEAVTI
jgi:glycosyltransferase involved in cell wall biosynthesis